MQGGARGPPRCYAKLRWGMLPASCSPAEQPDRQLQMLCLPVGQRVLRVRTAMPQPTCIFMTLHCSASVPGAGGTAAVGCQGGQVQQLLAERGQCGRRLCGKCTPAGVCQGQGDLGLLALGWVRHQVGAAAQQPAELLEQRRCISACTLVHVTCRLLPAWACARVGQACREPLTRAADAAACTGSDAAAWHLAAAAPGGPCGAAAGAAAGPPPAKLPPGRWWQPAPVQPPAAPQHPPPLPPPAASWSRSSIAGVMRLHNSLLVTK